MFPATLAMALLAQKGTPEYPPYAVPRLEGVTIPGLPPVTGRIAVDQFGYLPSGRKFAVISDPQKGYNEADSYRPGSQLEVRSRATGKAVFTGTPRAWQELKTDPNSGDRGWWLDFSSVVLPGEYYVFDPSTKLRSPVFEIGDRVYAPVLRAATRMFYYQRLGEPIRAPFAEEPWTEPAGLVQDKATRSVEAKDDRSKDRDMSGGWMDAGDTNKYPPFNGDTVHSLLYAYKANPKVFTDSMNIPESGNGKPDLLDEVKVQLDWLIRMQFPDGSVPVKMGNIDYNAVWPIHKDTRPRYYGPKDSGAAIYTASNLAHASRVYGQFTAWKPFAEDMKKRAILSWNWFQSNPRTFDKDTGEIKSGIANRTADEQDAMEAVAGLHLFFLTKDEKYHEAFKAKVGKLRQMSEGTWSPYGAGMAEVLTEYLTMPGRDTVLAARIKNQLKKSAEDYAWNPLPQEDLYRAWMVPGSYHWGSSSVRASFGFIALLAARHGGVDGPTEARLRVRAADLLHSFHGVNPLSMVYLSNMKGAELSASSIYHERYKMGSPFEFNPPPGYVVGGANQNFTGKAAEGQPSVEWIKTQPRGKAYADFNKAWPEASWELSEPALGYQCAYIRLLAEFTR